MRALRRLRPLTASVALQGDGSIEDSTEVRSRQVALGEALIHSPGGWLRARASRARRPPEGRKSRQQIPGSGRGVPQLLADGPPELRWEGLPFAGHFRSVLITTSERARHRHSRVARNSDSRRPETPGAGLPLGSRDPPRARHGSAAVPRWGLLRARGPRCAARPEPSKVNLCAPSTPLLLSHFPSLPPLGSALRRSPPSPSLLLSPGLSSAPLLPPASFSSPPSSPPSPEPDGLAPYSRSSHPLFSFTRRSGAVPYPYFLTVSIFSVSEATTITTTVTQILNYATAGAIITHQSFPELKSLDVSYSVWLTFFWSWIRVFSGFMLISPHFINEMIIWLQPAIKLSDLKSEGTPGWLSRLRVRLQLRS
ncbi:uncharacterized protein LOC113600919 isoform X3 [Acinonyx jubatus]|uniref:Uncharacterized protein LOC113600919 isoform X3 n=1 Tax=Acinonyx jubatus TaxID=32536 RepID=A0ABM3PEW7_ACIJB|nr:uncharacterized protein LOC113600919 isoform X3 [Acinonyx jubatus]